MTETIAELALVISRNDIFVRVEYRGEAIPSIIIVFTGNQSKLIFEPQYLTNDIRTLLLLSRQTSSLHVIIY